MYLKSLTLRGFKSFASATTLIFEPGITCVVGPNGSGKSNVVDAIAWVMGEQGAKTLRGGKMEDVIFAGTSGRAPLGRAEVALTIDNSDGALPIDYAEVTITRTMFRSGGSDYQINGESCRLLDVQELLSDSGIGREMHVIVGQGRLDAILHATPEERRGFIEEAAGVLKHRKRKEKALRKLDAMQVNLTRVSDLAVELRRQLKPLGRQAELARRAAVIQADLRDARLRLLADEVVTIGEALAKEEADEAELRQRRSQVEAALAASREREAVLEEAITAEAPGQARSQEAYVALAALRERFAGLRSLAVERQRGAQDSAPTESGPDPEVLERQAEEAGAQATALAAELERGTAELQQRGTDRRDAERALSAAEAGVHAARRAISERRERLAKLNGSVAAAQAKVESRRAEISRLSAATAEARARADAAEAAHRERESGRVDDSGVTDAEPGQSAAELTAAIDDARGQLNAAEAALGAARAAEAEAGREAAGAGARAEALRAGLARKDGSAMLLAEDAGIDGVLGRVAALITVEHGHEVAVGAALGAVADAVAVADAEAAVRALAAVQSADGGRTQLLVAAEEPADAPWPDLPASAVYAIDVVSAEPELRAALLRLLRRVAIVPDVSAAQQLIRDADVVAVTADGQILSRGWAAGGRAESLLEVKAALDEAVVEADAAATRRAALAADLAAATSRRADAAARLEGARTAKQAEDARLAAIAKELGSLGAAATAARNEVARSERAMAQAEQQAQADQAALGSLQQRLAAAEAEPAPSEPDEAVITAAKSGLEAARAAEVESRLAVRTAEERHRVIGAKAGELAASAAGVRRRRARAAEERRQRLARSAAAASVLAALERVEPSVAAAVEQAQADRAAAEAAKLDRDAELRAIRAAIRDALVEGDRLNDSVHRDELAKAQQRVRIEAAQDKALSEFGVDPETLVAEYGPEQLVPPSGVAAGDAEDLAPDAPEPVAVPYVREQQEARLRKAERELTALGRVNPLALEEFAALQERQAFLTEQLEDLKRSKADLLGIVSDVDERVRTVFAEAYADVAEQFAGVFGRLFPGGEGKLVLTDPDDMLNTGIEVEARPAGKRVKRLSLLSGGERSLTAVAFLVSLFKARPSPFYLLDEVEAALDDVNLGRLIGIMEELRGTSQLLVITHQKRTMDIADALYGVTMREGVSQVISQRMRELV